MASVEDVRIIELPKFLDARGNLSFAEQNNHIPFKFKRTFWMYDVPGGEAWGGHAFRKNEEFIVALSGPFDVIVENGVKKQTFMLNRSYYGLYVPAGLYRPCRRCKEISRGLMVISSARRTDRFLFACEVKSNE